MKGIVKNIAGEKVYPFFTKHWIFKSFIIYFPTIWSLVIFNSKWGLIFRDKDGSLNKFGLIIVIVLAIIYFCVTAITQYGDKRNKVKLSEEQDRYAIDNFIIESNNKICESKRTSLYKYVDTTMKGHSRKNILNILDPKEQLTFICREIDIAMERFSNIKTRRDILVTIAFNLSNQEDEWHWIESDDLSDCASLNDLMNEEDSVFYALYTEEMPYVFYNSKIKANSEKCYYLDKRDKAAIASNGDGSIVCKSIKIKYNDFVYGHAILSISSFNRKFVSMDSDVASFERNLKDLLDIYASRIQIELLNLWIKENSKQPSTR